MALAFFGNSMLIVFMVIVTGMTLHASSIAGTNVTAAPVYYLYETRGFEMLGEWGPKFICYRVSLAARSRWGSGSTVVAPMTKANLDTAVRHGRFVVLIGHGASGALMTSDNFVIWPHTCAAPGRELQFIYLSACEGGEKASEWNQRFKPAEVVTFDRTTGGIEHLWWFWFNAPDRLREVH